MQKRTAVAGSAGFLVIAPRVVAGLVPWWLTDWRAGVAVPAPVRAMSTTMAVRAAVLAAAPAVISELAVAEDLAAGRLIEIATPELDLRRVLRAIWDSTPQPPAGAARDLISHILTRLAPSAARRNVQHGNTQSAAHT